MNTKEQNRQQETNFGVISEFVANTRKSLDLRPTIQLLVDQSQQDALLGLGFPADCIPIMQLWRQNGPDILTSFSHAEELDMDKITALINLGLYTSFVFGDSKPSVLVVDYDTIPIQKSTKKPFKVSSFGLDFDLFGIKNDRMSMGGINNEKVAVLNENIAKLSSTDIGSPSELMINQIRSETSEILKSSETPMKRSDVISGMQGIILQRFTELGKILEDSLNKRPRNVGQLLSIFNQGLVASLFGDNRANSPLQDFQSKLFSDNTEFLNLVRQTIQILIRSRGIDTLKSIINPGEGLCMHGTTDNRYVLTKNDEDSFQLKSDTDIFSITSEEAIEFLSTATPLAKMESAALFAGAQTLHIGSEYGVRPKILEALGFHGAAFDYVMGLKVSGDKKHGNLGIVINDGGYIPSTLAYVMLGREKMTQLILSQAGRTNEPVRLSIPELRKYFAQNLIDEFVQAA